jgi:2-polyprenyl-6-methoxyphenol hydroxylase-like FAD-dependent oxidoreductase
MDLSRLDTPILILGGGSVGLAIAAELGMRNVPCIVLEKSDRPAEHPRATALNARSMEFMRRWGVADQIRAAAAPPDFPHTALYCTGLQGFVVAKVERPDHGSKKATEFSPESAQRCNQIWTDPILCQLARSFPSVDLRFRWEFEHLEQTADYVDVIAHDLNTGDRHTIRASHVVDCTGAHTPVRRALGVAMSGGESLTYHVSAYIRAPRLWEHHTMGKAALTNFIEANGLWRNLVSLDGRELYRFGIRGREYYDNFQTIDVPRLFREVAGECVPFDVISVGRWTARNVVADRYQVGRVFFAGDAAHLNHPASGLGLNTGLGDATNIGWKLSAVVQGWGGEGLLASYEAERRPIAVHNVKHAENMNKNDRGQKPPAYIGDNTPEGETARREMGERISEKLKLKFVTTGIALGFRYADSPICAKDVAEPPVQSVTEYEPGTYPGVRAPHAWISDDCSTLDLFGKGFTLLSFTQDSRGIAALQSAFDRRCAPLHVQSIRRADIRTLYECDLVLVRPDGHVAWRGCHAPENTDALAALVCGAA